MPEFSIKSTSRIFAIAASLAFAGNAMAQVNVHVDANKSCMLWLLNNTASETKYYCEGRSHLNNKGSCTINLPAGEYQFGYGGLGGFNLKIEANGDVNYQVPPPAVEGLKLKPNSIKFNTERVKIQSFGFPGSFEIQSDKQSETCNQDRDLEKRKSRLFIMKGAVFGVSGEWTERGERSGKFLKITNDNTLIVIPESVALKPDQEKMFTDEPTSFISENFPMTIGPNPYFWLKPPEQTPVPAPHTDANTILVSRGKCPTGYTQWNYARGRFLMGADALYIGRDGRRYRGRDTAGNLLLNRKTRITGGEVKHKLSYSEMPSHAHGMKTQLLYKTLSGKHEPNGTILNVREYGSPDQMGTQSAGSDKSHNNIPPFIAVNFCVPKGRRMAEELPIGFVE